ncbi:hypothetical protein BC828DRAFT_8655 [Blastocladiella britannica]|nr:hypothetical protein BC828DRAFT_8655 [Blastocladiella britannica]
MTHPNSYSSTYDLPTGYPAAYTRDNPFPPPPPLHLVPLPISGATAPTQAPQVAMPEVPDWARLYALDLALPLRPHPAASLVPVPSHPHMAMMTMQPPAPLSALGSASAAGGMTGRAASCAPGPEPGAWNSGWLFESPPAIAAAGESSSPPLRSPVAPGTATVPLVPPRVSELRRTQSGPIPRAKRAAMPPTSPPASVAATPNVGPIISAKTAKSRAARDKAAERVAALARRVTELEAQRASLMEVVAGLRAAQCTQCNERGRTAGASRQQSL